MSLMIQKKDYIRLNDSRKASILRYLKKDHIEVGEIEEVELSKLGKEKEKGIMF